MTSPPRRSLSDGERLDWLRLIRCEGIGPISFRGLLERHGSAAAVIAALPEISRRSGRSLRLPAESGLKRELDALQALGARLVAFGEPDYPAALESIESAPPLLAIHGSAAVLSRPTVAIVGARNASALGQSFAAGLAAGLAAAGFATVSGLARGIDRAVHAATAKTGTVAVVAGGLGRIYPPQHEQMARDLAAAGCVVSEMPFDRVATARDFPRRNRIVSGLSLGVVIVEAAMKSGSLITARFALEQGREVMAAPGSPLDPRNDGSNHLIRQGATLIRHVEDVLEVLSPLVERGGFPLGGRAAPRQGRLDFNASGGAAAWGQAPPAEAGLAGIGDEDQDRLIAVLGPSPVSVDDLVRACGLAPRQVQLILLDLDLAGRIERHGNGMVSLL
ncbi:DNA-processing protein DprA [Labrys monachus]|uniref:DNA processing protein n=1 Tax=Labrys monachus TaxID=217067 RepID=A0ABU0FEL8_9HYPH|nr:DNA-processing protein DprA [Labrys monachus]MDQ0393053.1 DNA processing protein [Labrys monachus]